MVNEVLLVGPSRIGQAHLRELIKSKFSKIYLLGKKLKEIELKI